jgi:DNA-binding response OmpR family regulator
MDVTLVLLPGAPPWDRVVDELARYAIDVEVREAGALPPAPERPLLLLWSPAGAGEEMLSRAAGWRDRAERPVMLLGCAPLGEAADSERALAAGFDDFMAGRASPRELAARIRALSRRTAARPAGERKTFGRLTLDDARHEAVVDGQHIPLTAMEMTVMATLVAAGGRTLTRTELLDLVWGEDNLDVGTRAVDNLILRLRRKLGDPNLIITVRSIGFRLAGE